MVEADVVDHPGVARYHAEPFVGLEAAGLVRLDVAELDLAGTQRIDAVGRVAEVAVDHAVQLRFALAIGGVGLQLDELVGLVAHEAERAGADRGLRPPRIAVEPLARQRFQRMPGEHHQLGQHVEQRAVWLAEFEYRGQRIGRADLGDVAKPRAEDRAGTRVLGEFDGEGDIGGREILAVVPFHVRQQMEGVAGLFRI